jgi:hypothetical protein
LHFTRQPCELAGLQREKLVKGGWMRGPGYKLSGDVRRTWRCPRCGRERKLDGDVTTLQCGCEEGTWMQIVRERTMSPRPLQRPSDVERHPIDFGIEPSPPQATKPEATIIKPAISRDPEPEIATSEPAPELATKPVPAQETEGETDDWGEGIL